jgi:hypothetical protein
LNSNECVFVTGSLGVSGPVPGGCAVVVVAEEAEAEAEAGAEVAEAAAVAYR